jgi:hypothetical protein
VSLPKRRRKERYPKYYKRYLRRYITRRLAWRFEDVGMLLVEVLHRRRAENNEEAHP